MMSREEIGMKKSLVVDSNFSQLKLDLKQKLKQRERRFLDNPGYKLAAVNILLMDKANEPHVLLTQRSEQVKTHKGQISLPGGTFEIRDENILATAYRETFEEIGIAKDKIDFLGRFDDYLSIFGFHVSCFVGSIEYPAKYIFDKNEVADYLEAPLALFIDKQYDQLEYYQFQGKRVKMYTYFYNNFKIWGLTARFLTDFGEIFR